MRRLVRWFKCQLGVHEATLFTGCFYVCGHCRALFR